MHTLMPILYVLNPAWGIIFPTSDISHGRISRSNRQIYCQFVIRLEKCMVQVFHNIGFRLLPCTATNLYIPIRQGSSTFWVRGPIYIFYIILRAAIFADYKIIMDILNIIIGKAVEGLENEPISLWWCLIYPWSFYNLQWLQLAGLYERCKLALELRRLKTPALGCLASPTCSKGTTSFKL